MRKGLQSLVLSSSLGCSLLFSSCRGSERVPLNPSVTKPLFFEPYVAPSRPSVPLAPSRKSSSNPVSSSNMGEYLVPVNLLSGYHFYDGSIVFSPVIREYSFSPDPFAGPSSFRDPSSIPPPSDAASLSLLGKYAWKLFLSDDNEVSNAARSVRDGVASFVSSPFDVLGLSGFSPDVGVSSSSAKLSFSRTYASCITVEVSYIHVLR